MRSIADRITALRAAELGSLRRLRRLDPTLTAGQLAGRIGRSRSHVRALLARAGLALTTSASRPGRPPRK